MAKCYTCGKGSQTGFRKSHSNIKTKHIFKANLHYIRVMNREDLEKKIRVCSKCYKKMKNDYADGVRIPLTPLSFLNQAKARIVKPKKTAVKEEIAVNVEGAQNG